MVKGDDMKAIERKIKEVSEIADRLPEEMWRDADALKELVHTLEYLSHFCDGIHVQLDALYRQMADDYAANPTEKVRCFMNELAAPCNVLNGLNDWKPPVVAHGI